MRSKHREKIIALREKGRSYNEIAKILLVSKGTVSYWLSGMPLTPQAQQRLHGNIQKAYERGLFTFNKDRTEKVQRENKMICTESSKLIARLSNYELLLVVSPSIGVRVTKV